MLAIESSKDGGLNPRINVSDTDLSPGPLIAGGTYDNHPNVIWTSDEKLMLSDVSGDPATVEDLHTWWDAYG